MKALLCVKHGNPEDLLIQEVDSPKPGKGEVIISVKACGLNFPDTLIIQGKYQFQPELPFSPGGEVAGVVKEVGENVTHLKAGDRVVSGTSWGGLAEEVLGKASNTYVIPDEMPFDQAAASLMTYGTSYHALVDRAQIKSGETMLVLGAAGGVGTAAIQIGKLLGAKVIAAASTNEKLEYCKSLGADDTINYTTEDLKTRTKELTAGRGVDVVFDPVGGDLTEQAFRTCAWGGRHLVVGFALGEIPKIPLNLPLLKSASLTGVFWGGFFRNYPDENRKNIEQLMGWFASGQLQAQIHKTYSLEETADAMKELLERKVRGKVVISITD